GEAAEQQAGVGAREVSPVALRFQAEHPRTGLPAVTDLATDRAARGVMATFRDRKDGSAGGRRAGPAIVARTPAAGDNGVENAPIIHTRDHRGGGPFK